jgi:hypothetical protein
MRVVLLVIVAGAVLACSDPAVRSRVDAPSSYLSCHPTPNAGVDWQTVQLAQPEVTFRLPPGWSEKRWEVPFGDVESWHTFRSEADLFQNLRIIEERDSAAGPLPRAARQADYTDYVECEDSIAGRRALLQAWRGGGTIFRGGQQTPSFGTHLTLEVGPGRYAMASASSADTAGRDEIITILKTLRPRASDDK